MSGSQSLRRNSTAASDALFERALKVMPGGSTRQASFFDPHPPYAVSGKGARLTDVDGNVYLDFANNFFSMIHGHAHPALQEAIIGQVRLGSAFIFPTELEIQLAEAICERSDALEVVRFANSGTEGVMAAIKAARAFTGRPALAKVEGAYHGSYDHVEISLDGSPTSWGELRNPERVKYARGTPDAVVSDTVIVPFNDAPGAAAILEANADRLAALIVDLQPSRAGMIPASLDFVTTLREVTTRLGIVLIVDEVVSFRLGYGGSHSVFGLKPDLMALGKIIGGGLPIGAIAGRRDIMSVFDSRGRKPDVAQGGTFTANPMTMAAGLACLKLLDRAAIDRLNGLGDRLRSGVSTWARKSGAAVQITGSGSLFRLHLSAEQIRNYRTSRVTDESKAKLVAIHLALLDRGFILTPNLSGSLSTPMTEADIDSAVVAITETMGDYI